MNLDIPQTSGQSLPITLEDGDRLFMVGANGSGKSALIQHLVSSHRNDKIRRIAAHRQTAFHSDRPNFTHPDRGQFEKQIKKWDLQPDARWRGDYQFGDQKQLAVLLELIDKENFQARSVRELIRNKDVQKAKEAALESASPFGQINELFRIANLTVSLKLSDDGEIRAHHGNEDTNFSIAQMSDGERSAAILAATVLTAEPGTVLLIDEPERHLHRSIIEPFLSALFKQRKDCAFVISTHEIALPAANPDTGVLMIRSCEWEGETAKAWDVDFLEADADLPEELKLAILGARRKILFVEGTTSSLDLQLYSVLFPGISVVPKGNCIDVQRAVNGLRESQHLHHVKAFGLIDRDNRPPEEVRELAKRGIFALDCYSVESLYYGTAIMEKIEKRQSDVSPMIADLRKARKVIVEEVLKHKERLCALLIEKRVRNAVEAQLPTHQSLLQNPVHCVTFDASDLLADEEKKFDELVSSEDTDGLVDRYCVSTTGALDAAAKILGFDGCEKYESAVGKLLVDDDAVRRSLCQRLSDLTQAIAG